MTEPMLIVFGIVAGAIVLLSWGRPRADVVAVLVSLSLLLTGVLSPEESFAGFGDPVVILIAAVFVVGAALEHTGVVHRLSVVILKAGGGNEARLIVLIMLLVAALSAFMSSTAVTAMFIPVVLAITARTGLNRKRMLMPVAVAATIGGMMTQISSLPNMIVANVISQSNFGDKTRVGRLLIRGDIVSRLVGKSHSLALQQDFDYIDNEAFEYGGQSFGPALLSRFELSPTFALTTRAQAFFILLGAVNSNLSFLADVANQERIREYDYGPGAGVSAELYLQRKNVPVLVARYRGSYIDVSNGSIYNNDTADIGLNSTHGVQQLQLKLEIPVTKGVSIGADGSLFFRRSHYDFEGSGVPPEIGEGRRTITQRNPEARVFLAWTYNH